MTYGLRQADAARDYPAVAMLFSTADPDYPFSAEDLRREDRNALAGSIRRVIVAVDDAGRIAGVSEVARRPWAPPGVYRLSLVVDETHRRRGIGTQLCEDALRFLTAGDGVRVKANVRDDCPPRLRFAEQQGFTVERHTFQSTLDLTTFDETPFAHAIHDAERAGIRFFTLAEIGDGSEERRRLYEVRVLTGRSTPGFDGTFPPYDEFSRSWFEAPWYHAEGQIVAADGGEWIGLASVGVNPKSGRAFHGFTGVVPAHQGRGIAHALKVLSIRAARDMGARAIGTGNDSRNAPMLAINRKYGYRPEPGVYGVVRQLSGGRI